MQIVLASHYFLKLTKQETVTGSNVSNSVINLVDNGKKLYNYLFFNIKNPLLGVLLRKNYNFVTKLTILEYLKYNLL